MTSENGNSTERYDCREDSKIVELIRGVFAAKQSARDEVGVLVDVNFARFLSLKLMVELRERKDRPEQTNCTIISLGSFALLTLI
eukprot:scaffold38356_cov237-Amphora_coffeaeformis.AAC.2